MTTRIYIQYEFQGGDNFICEGLEQIAERKRQGKNRRVGVKVKDRSLVKKLKAKKGCERVEMVRLHCYASFNTPLMATQAVYRSHNDDGTVRETMGDKHFFKRGEFAFKTNSGEYSKIFLEREGSVVKARNQAGAQVKVSNSMKVQMLRC